MTAATTVASSNLDLKYLTLRSLKPSRSIAPRLATQWRVLEELN